MTTELPKQYDPRAAQERFLPWWVDQSEGSAARGEINPFKEEGTP